MHEGKEVCLEERAMRKSILGGPPEGFAGFIGFVGNILMLRILYSCVNFNSA